MSSPSPGGGPGLAAAGLPRLVSIPEQGRFVRVRPPTVREAVTLLEALPGSVVGDSHDAELVIEVLDGWLPEEIRDVLPEAPGHFTPLLTRLMNEGSGLDDFRKLKKNREDGEEEDDDEKDDGPPAWDLLLGDYCTVYDGDPWQVYNETPWPFFLRMLLRLETVSSRELMRWAQIEMLPHAGKKGKEIADRLARQSKGDGQGAPPRLYTQDEIDDWEPDDAVKADREALRAAMRRRKKEDDE